MDLVLPKEKRWILKENQIDLHATYTGWSGLFSSLEDNLPGRVLDAIEKNDYFLLQKRKRKNFLLYTIDLSKRACIEDIENAELISSYMSLKDTLARLKDKKVKKEVLIYME